MVAYDERTEAAIMSVMADYPLEPGQALWLGPKSVAILAAPHGFRGKLPDKMVMEKNEWCVKESRAPGRFPKKRTNK